MCNIRNVKILLRFRLTQNRSSVFYKDYYYRMFITVLITAYI